jgi:hypothetical protein
MPAKQAKSSKQKKPTIIVSNHEMRRVLEADVKAFLAAGNQIEQVPTGQSGQDPLGSRRHIVLGNKKKS